MSHDVFISYSIKDRLLADALCHKLEEDSIRCWIAPRDISPGGSWAGEIADAIPHSKLMILVFSANANASKQVLREVELAITNNLVIIPMKIEDIMPTGGMSYYLSTTHWIDAVGNKFDARINTLSKKVQTMLEIEEKPKEEKKPVTENIIQPIPQENKSLSNELPKTNKSKSRLKAKRKKILLWVFIPLSLIAITALAYFGLKYWTDINFSAVKSDPPATSFNTIPNKTTAWDETIINDIEINDLGNFKPEDFDYEPNQDVYIEDYNLRNAIIETLNATREHQMSNTDQILISDMFDLKYLLLSTMEEGKGLSNYSGILYLGYEPSEINDSNFAVIITENIKTLSGLQYAKNLMGLAFLNFKIEDMSPITALKSLVYLKIENDEITDISYLEDMKYMLDLELYGLNLNSLNSLSGLNNLNKLNLTFLNNSAVDLSPLQNLQNLEGLFIENVYIEDISPINSLTNLMYMGLMNCGLTDISLISDLQKLESLGIQGNNVRKISSLLNHPNLKYIDLGGNYIEDIEILLGLKNLREVWLDKIVYNKTENKEVILGLQAMGCIVYTDKISPATLGMNPTDIVHFEDNALKNSLLNYFKEIGETANDEITIDNMFTITSLVIIPSGNKFDYHFVNEFMGKDNYVLLSIDNLTSLEGLQYARNLSVLCINGYNISDFNLFIDLQDLWFLDLNYNSISDITWLSTLYTLEHLMLEGNTITDISAISSLRNLENLNLSVNNINDISPISNLGSIEGLYLSANSISDLSPLSGKNSLIALEINGNLITDISPLNNLINLTEININDNSIYDISSLNNLPELRYFYINQATYNSNLETIDKLIKNGCEIIIAQD